MVKNSKFGLDGVQHQLVYLVDGLEVLLYAIFALQGVVLVVSVCSGSLVRCPLALALECVSFYLVGLCLDHIQFLQVAQLLVVDELPNFAGVAHFGLASHALVSDLAEVVAGAGLARRTWAFDLF